MRDRSRNHFERRKVTARIEVQHLVNFLAVAETGSFRQAASVIGIGQSAVSRRVQRLEDLLGVSLFERRPSGARLTPAGERFANGARPILDDLDAAVATAQTAGVAGNGHLRIGLIASLSKGPLREIFKSFLADHNDIELYFIESDRSALLTLLSHRRLDAIYAAGIPAAEVGDGIAVANEKIYVAVASDSPAAHHERISWEDLAEMRFVVSSLEPGPEIHDYILRRISDLGRSVDVLRHGLGREGIMTLVGLGLGVSLVADHWRGVRYPNVTFVPIRDEEETVPFSLTWRPENDNPALRRFISLARIEAKRNGALS